MVIPPNLCDSTEVDDLKVTLRDTCLNTRQMTSLRTVFNEYINGQGDNNLKCAHKAVYNRFLASGKKISICIDGSIIGNGSYRPGSGTIFYKDEAGIPVVSLFGHEFFHGFQDAFYAGGTSQYNTGTRMGFPNIEFEQALFYDIINGSGDANAMGSTASLTIVQEYKGWLDTITNGNTEYPKQFSNFGSKYYYFLNKFYQNAYGYAGIGSMKTDLPPNAILNIFLTSNCK